MLDYHKWLREAKRRREKMKELRAKGWTLQRIADKCGVTPQRVRQIVKEGK